MKRIVLISLLILLAVLATACAGNRNRDWYPRFEIIETTHNIGFVDKRFELTALVFRLAGSVDFNDADTPYQRRLNETFRDFRDHAIVDFARRLGFSQDAVFRFAVHLDKTEDGFVFVENTDFLLQQNGDFVRWTQDNAHDFLALLNDFYIETDFAAFFGENTSFYMETNRRFYAQVYHNVNKEWFARHGLNPENMRAVVSPSMSRMGYAAWVEGETAYDRFVYAMLPYAADFIGFHRFIVHEYAHALGNPIADVWYAQNDEFRHWATVSIDPVRNPGHAISFVMAGEYVTRAFEILYLVENHNANLAVELLQQMQFTFPYMAEVFAMVTNTEILNLRENVMEYVLGVPFEIDKTIHTLSIDEGDIRWRYVHLYDQLAVESFARAHFANVGLTSRTGEVIIIDIHGEPSLWIDISSGAGIEGRDARFRQYSAFPLFKPLDCFFPN